MPLIPTPVVDKNGRATTVHKRSGSSAVSGKTLSSAKPTVTRSSKAKIDQPYAHPVEAGFPLNRFGIVLNEMRPHLALDRESVAKGNRTIQVTSREIYSWVSKGLTARDGIYLSYFKIVPEELEQVTSRLAAMGQGPEKFRPKPWADAILAADIDHEAVLAAFANGLSQYDLDEMPPENAPGTILAYGYKVLSKTDLVNKVRDGKVSWDDIKAIGVSRAAKYEWTIADALSGYAAERGPHPLDYATLGDIIKDAEKHPRTSISSRNIVPTEMLISSHATLYRKFGEKFWDLHMPETFDHVERLTGAQDDLIGCTMYCDEVIHEVRSDPGIVESVISARNGRSNRTPGGSYTGQYPEQRDPEWNFGELVEFRAAGLTVDQCVYALTKGLTPERAKGVLDEGIPLAVNEGWL